MASTEAMGPAEVHPNADDLLRHARWVRRMAGALLRDEAAAEDLVQDTWLAALTRAPGTGRLRPWLRQVARNFARQHHRGKARRVAREATARAPEGPEAPDEFAARLEAEQRLTRALAELAEPYRSTLMLRYYEDLEPAAIAARLDLPGGTVRWRLARALELLRERLDQAHDGDRRAWSLALAPLARLELATGAGTLGAATILSGVFAMNVLKLSVAAAAVLVVGLSLTGVLPGFSPFARREAPLAVGFRPLTLEAVAAAEPDTQPVPQPLATERVALTGSTALESVPAAAETSLARLDARLFGRSGALAGARLVVRHGGARHEALSASSDGLAAVDFPLAEGRALVRFELAALGYASEERSAVCAAGETTHLGRIELVPGGAVSGRVVDERGVPLAGARLSLGSLDAPYPRLELLRLEVAGDSVPACTSESDGRFFLRGVPAGMVRVWAHAEGRLASYTPPLEVRAGQESTGVELTLVPLAPENRLHGIVLAPDGTGVPHAELEFRHAMDGGDSVRSGSTTADAEGRFEFRLPPDTLSWVTASDPAGRYGPASASELANGAQELVLTLREVRRVELVVTGRGAEPVETFALELLSAGGETRLGGLARGEHAEGRALFVLPEQPFLARVHAAGHRTRELGPLEPGRVGAELACALEPVVGLAGVVTRAGAPVAGVRVRLLEEVSVDTELTARGYRLVLWPEARDEAVSDAEGRFLLTPPAAGGYFVRAEPLGSAPTVVGPVAVGDELGGPPLELVLGEGGAIEGRVKLARGADPEGAIVGLTRGDGDERTQRVGSDGRFRFEALVPGPWRVELCSAELFGPIRGISSTRNPRVEPFELDANCVVREGETTYVDVGDEAGDALTFEGTLTLDERPAVGWSAHLGPAGKLDLEGEGWTPLDSDGHFTLRARAPGAYRLTLRRQGGEFQEQSVFEDLELTGSDAPWERALNTGKLQLAGVGWDGEGPPPAVHLWRGSGQLFALTVGVGDSGRALEVPAGPGRLVAPSESMDLESWKLLREVDVPRVGLLRVELESDGGR